MFFGSSFAKKSTVFSNRKNGALCCGKKSAFGKLLQAVIYSVLCHKLVVAALFHNAFVVENNYNLRSADGA